MNVACPSCNTVYRIDPERVPERGALTRCRECDTAFLVSADMSRSPGVITTARPYQTAEAGTGETAAAIPVFGPQDPATRARRLARALVSDMTVYNADRWEESRDQGTLRDDFRDEILKSWDEYVEQVGETLAKRTPYFRDALNEILAGGERVF